MSVLRCDGCGAKFPSTTLGRVAAEKHVKSHPSGAWMFVVLAMLYGGLIMAAVVNAVLKAMS